MTTPGVNSAPGAARIAELVLRASSSVRYLRSEDHEHVGVEIAAIARAALRGDEGALKKLEELAAYSGTSAFTE